MTPVLARPRQGEVASQPAANTPPIYLDNQSSTRVDPRVLEAMLPYFTEDFGNPHSTSHAYGRIAAEAVERARGEIAALINADPRARFTSGAKDQSRDQGRGAFRCAPRSGAGRDHIVPLLTEHKCTRKLQGTRAEGFG